MGDMDREETTESPEPVIHRRASRTPSIADIQEIPILNASSSQKFSRLPQREPVDLKFEDLHYAVSLGYRKGTKEILHGVYGRFPPAQLIAIMGPSGAGKSTLLDILSGYRITGVTGTVSVDDLERDLEDFRRLSCYITQDDRLQPLLTVRENMMLASELKLGTNIPFKEKKAIIVEILLTLGLAPHQNTRCARLSGGQKKRLSIALELINNPLVMFLDEPTTGLDSASCTQCLSLLQVLAKQGRTIVCTIHQPSASLFDMFDQVYVLAQGNCLYQGATEQLVPYLQAINLPCPLYHNPADYVIELACCEYGEDKIETMFLTMYNGQSLRWFGNMLEGVKPKNVRSPSLVTIGNVPCMNIKLKRKQKALQETSLSNQLKILMKRGFLKVQRDQTLTHLRLIVNVLTGLMLGVLFIQAGDEGSRVLDNYNLLFGILMHHMMTTMMLTILTFPSELNILKKEHFNRWYSLKSYYISVTIVNIPVTVICCILFTVLVYFMSSQPNDLNRFSMFFTISLLVVFVAESVGFMIGAVFDVVNGTFLGPTLSVPMMMFAGFGVNLRDLPPYLRWGSYVSYLRYGLEGYVGAIYGNRTTLQCNRELYCHYRYPNKFLDEIAMEGDQFWNDVLALSLILLLTRIFAYILLRWKLHAVR